MRIESQNSDSLILGEVGRRLARNRLERNISQAQLANEAGVSKATIERLEAGEPIRSNNLVRVLRALGHLDVLDRLVPEPLPSPIERLQLQGRQRQRAGRQRGEQPGDEPRPWQWGTGPSADDER